MSPQATRRALPLLSYVITYARMSAVVSSQNGVGPRVRALREAMDLSLRDLAER